MADEQPTGPAETPAKNALASLTKPGETRELAVEPESVELTLTSPLLDSTTAPPPTRTVVKNAASNATTAATTQAAKAGTASPARPTATPASSHSRLVTTKLTVAPLLSVSPAGQGWSRPASAAPSTSNAPTPPNAALNLPTTNSLSSPSPRPPPSTTTTTTNATPPYSSAPQLPHAGPVIQPLPRGSVVPNNSNNKDTSPGRPVWGNSAKSTAPAARIASNEKDFPTAAEAAHGETQAKQAKIDDTKEAADTAAANKLARAEEADTFRGVHLDPNAHHWDEEEDDDNFLDGVIEFGDGRQYKVQPTDSPSPQKPSVTDARPVSKEERFADDFDRSWPRSRSSPEAPGPAIRQAPPIQTNNTRNVSRSPAVTQHQPLPSSPSQSSIHSPQDTASSRVLFNERSNRLEPYSNSHRGGPTQHPSRRVSDSHLSPTEPRNGGGPASVQLLQKTEPSGRPRGFGHSGSFQREGSTTRINNNSMPLPVPSNDARRGPPLSPAMDTRGRRLSTMGPPPIPSSVVRDVSRDARGRQLPPHLLAGAPPLAPPPNVRRMSSRDSQTSQRVPESPRNAPSSWAAAIAAAPLPHASPTSTHSLAVSPPVSQPPALVVDLDAITKEFMGSSAARAKARKQAEEEEEMEARKERTRKRRAELDAKIKAEKDEKARVEKEKAEKGAEVRKAAHEERQKRVDAAKALEEEEEARKNRAAEAEARKQPGAVSIIEEAIGSAKAAAAAQASSFQAPAWGKLQRPASQDAIARTPRPLHGRHFSQSGTPLPPVSPSPAGQAESWRTKAAPLPPRQPHTRSSATSQTPSFPPPPLETEKKDDISMTSDEGLEVVDFSEMAKFVGVDETIPEEGLPTEEPTLPSSRSRRMVASDFFDEPASTLAPAVRPPPPLSKSDLGPWRRKPEEPLPVDENSPPPTAPKVADAKLLSQSEVVPELGAGFSQTIVSPQTSPAQQRRVVSASRGPTVTSLDYTMSRIRGALNGMQTDSPSPRSSHVHVRSMDRFQQGKLVHLSFRHLQEEEERETFHVTMEEAPRSPKPAWKLNVRLPKVSTAREPLTKKQLAAFKAPTVVRLDVLSWDPPVEGMSKKDFSLNDILFRKLHVHKGKQSKPTVVLPKRAILRTPSTPAKVHIPASPTPSLTCSAVSETSTGRKAVAKSEELLRSAPGLNTTSRSPPPELPSNPLGVTSISPQLPIHPTHPKMPAGSGVAIRRDARIDAVEPETTPTINFIVGNELDSPQAEKSVEVSRVVGGFASHNSPETRTKADDSIPATPSTHTAWPTYPSAKDSPARGPDPEHLKAVWSQAAEESGMPAVNSLEGIVDDLASIPFTLQDVKSEDGSTPPPSTALPSRMSLHDVTRAFQQVPSGSSNSIPQPRSAPMSPNAHPTPTRQQTYAYSLPPAPNANVRPPYVYQPPMMYPQSMAASPVPRPMQPNGHPPAMYPQQIWMPGPPPPHMRHMQSYPPPMMPYSPGGVPPMSYPPGPGSPIYPPSAGPRNGANRGRGGMSMMSPGVHNVPHPQMYGSPAQAHAIPQGGYLPPSGRPVGMSGHRPQPSHYTPVPSNAFHPPPW